MKESDLAPEDRLLLDQASLNITHVARKYGHQVTVRVHPKIRWQEGQPLAASRNYEFEDVEEVDILGRTGEEAMYLVDPGVNVLDRADDPF